MPVRWCGDRNGGPNSPPLLKYCIDDQLSGQEVGERLLDLRKRSIQLHEELIVLQKQFGSDRENAKFFKEESRQQLRIVRACRLLIPYVLSDVPGDCEWRDHYEFPEELWPALSYVSAFACYPVEPLAPTEKGTDHDE